MPDVDYYELLGVAPKASTAEIERAYQAVAPRVGPDLVGTPVVLELVHRAFEVLRDPGRRAEYDRRRSGEPAGNRRVGGGERDHERRSGGDRRPNSMPGLAGTGRRNGGSRQPAADETTRRLPAPRTAATRLHHHDYHDYRDHHGSAAAESVLLAVGEPAQEPARGSAQSPPSRPARQPSQGERGLTAAKPSWWDSADPEAEVDVVPGFGQYRLEFWVAAVVWVLLAGYALFTLWRDSALFTIVLTFVTTVFLVKACRHQVRDLDQWQTIPALLMLGGLAATVPFVIIDNPFAGIGRAGYLAGFAVVPWLARRYREVRALDKSFNQERTARRIFGWPGSPPSGSPPLAGRPSGPDPVRIGGRLTAPLLEVLLRIPAVRIFHALGWPEWAPGDIGHAVVSGRRIALVDSRLWRPGVYRFDASGSVLRDGQPFKAGAAKFAAAVIAYQDLLWNADIQGFLVVHATGPGMVQIDMPIGSSIQVVAAGEAAERIGDWLAGESTLVDRRLLVPLHGMLRTPTGAPRR